MIPVHSAAQIRRSEERAIAEVGGDTLMQRAAFALAVTCAGLLRRTRGALVGSRVVLLVGSGNNGGDALWAGAHLSARGCGVVAIALSEVVHQDGADALRRAGGRLMSAQSVDAAERVRSADLVVDGIVGIGGAGGLRAAAADLVSAARDALVVAVDIPSGVDTDTGAVLGAAVDADVTVTFAALKPALVLAPGRERAGTVRVVDIGLHLGDSSTMCLSVDDAAAQVAEPEGQAHKYTRGVAGLATGSPAYPGAALLSVDGARRAGIGMVRFWARPGSPAGAIVAGFPDVVVDDAPPADQRRVSAWGAGCGFEGGRDDEEATITEVLTTDVPVVLDAGALSALGQSAAIRACVRARHDRGLPTILTPHTGEFERMQPGLLAQCGDRLRAARAAAERTGAIVVLKGPGTVVADPGGTAYVDTEGTAALGTAGSGDVLTGLMTGLLAAGWARGERTIAEAAITVAAAVFVHGRAGRVAERGGPVTATDISAAIGPAIASIRRGES